MCNLCQAVAGSFDANTLVNVLKAEGRGDAAGAGAASKQVNHKLTGLLQSQCMLQCLGNLDKLFTGNLLRTGRHGHTRMFCDFCRHQVCPIVS